MSNVLSHFHVHWWDSKTEPEAHILCLTAANEIDAVRHADGYLGEALGKIRDVVQKGDSASQLMCKVED